MAPSGKVTTIGDLAVAEIELRQAGVGIADGGDLHRIGDLGRRDAELGGLGAVGAHDQLGLGRGGRRSRVAQAGDRLHLLDQRVAGLLQRLAIVADQGDRHLGAGKAVGAELDAGARNVVEFWRDFGLELLLAERALIARLQIDGDIGAAHLGR